MRENNGKAMMMLKAFLRAGEFYSGSSAYDGGLKTGLFMPKEAIPADKKEWVEFLMS